MTIQQFWKSPFNVFDLIVTTFCALTLLVLAFAGCGAASKEEEMLDTLLLIARNVLQFGRLASVMRQCVFCNLQLSSIANLRLSHCRSGQSIFTQPKPIDLSAARRAGYNSLDLDLEYDDEDDAERAQHPVLFDAVEPHSPPGEDVPFTDLPTSRHDGDEADAWRD